jgi:hypothetical protein
MDAFLASQAALATAFSAFGSQLQRMDMNVSNSINQLTAGLQETMKKIADIGTKAAPESAVTRAAFTVTSTNLATATASRKKKTDDENDLRVGLVS